MGRFDEMMAAHKTGRETRKASLFDRVASLAEDTGTPPSSGDSAYYVDVGDMPVELVGDYLERSRAALVAGEAVAGDDEDDLEEAKKGSLRQLKYKVWMMTGSDTELAAAFKAKGDAHAWATSKKDSPFVKEGGKFVAEDDQNSPPPSGEGAEDSLIEGIVAVLSKARGATVNGGYLEVEPKDGKQRKAIITAARAAGLKPEHGPSAEIIHIEFPQWTVVEDGEGNGVAEATASDERKAVNHATQWLGKITGDINRTAKKALNSIYWSQGKAERFRAGMKKARQGITDAQNAVTQVSIGIIRSSSSARPAFEDEDTEAPLAESTSRFGQLAGLLVEVESCGKPHDEPDDDDEEGDEEDEAKAKAKAKVEAEQDPPADCIEDWERAVAPTAT